MSREQLLMTTISSRVTVALLAAIALCAAIAFFGFWWTGESQERVPFLNVEILPQEKEMVVVSSDETLSRPLFWASRRPIEIVEKIETVEPVQPETVAPLEGVRLLGVIAIGARYTALLEVDGKVTRVSAGTKVKQWTVSRLTARDVTLRAGQSRTVLSLERELHQSIKLEL